METLLDCVKRLRRQWVLIPYLMVDHSLGYDRVFQCVLPFFTSYPQIYASFFRWLACPYGKCVYKIAGVGTLWRNIVAKEEMIYMQ